MVELAVLVYEVHGRHIVKSFVKAQENHPHSKEGNVSRSELSVVFGVFGREHEAVRERVKVREHSSSKNCKRFNFNLKHFQDISELD